MNDKTYKSHTNFKYFEIKIAELENKLIESKIMISNMHLKC